MKILITGAHGFFGRNLARAWANTHQLLLTDCVDSFAEAPNDYLPSNRFFHCDLLTSMYVLRDHMRMNGSEIVVHCAARTRITPSWEQYPDYYNTNISASLELFEMAQKAGVKKFIYFSSSSVYGNNNTTTQLETDKLNLTSPYAVSKMAAEAALLAQSYLGTTELIIVRPFTMYGDYMSYGTYALVISKFLAAMENNEPIILDGGGLQTRDFVHVSDAIAALELLVSNATNRNIYNIGSGTAVSIKQLADVIPCTQIVGPLRIGPIKRTCANINKLRQLGYEPKVNVIEWLTAQVKELTVKQHTT